MRIALEPFLTLFKSARWYILVVDIVTLKNLETIVIQAEFSLEESHIHFLHQFKLYGFKDESELVQVALSHLQQQLELQSLKKSAELYAEVYEEDHEIQELTESALSDWPQ